MNSDAFKNTIQAYLEGRAKEDSLFAVSFAKEGKSVDNCVTYILNTVQKSGCNGFTDDEVFSMAVHYYDEDNIEVGKPNSARVVVNHSVPADKPIKQEPKPVAAPKRKPEAEKKPQFVTGSLFD